MIRVTYTRATGLANLQEEYELLLKNSDCVFIQVEIVYMGEVKWFHLKGGKGHKPEDLMSFLTWELRSHRFEIRRLHYHYGDKVFRALEVLR